MSLRIVHLFFITVASLTSFLTGWITYVQAQSGVEGMMAVSIFSNLSGLVIMAYGIWFAVKKFGGLS